MKIPRKSPKNTGDGTPKPRNPNLRPPWKPGENPNPNGPHPGRPRTRPMTEPLGKILDSTYWQGEPNPENRTNWEVGALKIAEQYREGNPKAQDIVAERFEGRVPQRVEMRADPVPEEPGTDLATLMMGMKMTASISRATEVEADDDRPAACHEAEPRADESAD